MTDIEVPGDLAEAERIETAFRRGVLHGAKMTCRAASSGVPLPLLHDWIYTTLEHWRASHPRHVSIKPPSPPVYQRRTAGSSTGAVSKRSAA